MGEKLMSTMELTIDVTQADIDNGVPYDSEECAVAIAAYRALTEAHPELSELIPFTDGDSMYFFGGPDGTDMLWSAAAPEASSFIWALTRGEPVAPFAFTLVFEAES
jgi:hypothetical protein